MTVQDIAEFYSRLNRELEHRTERKSLERDLRECEAYVKREDVPQILRNSTLQRRKDILQRLKEISF